jgi:hypothetical protein
MLFLSLFLIKNIKWNHLHIIEKMVLWLLIHRNSFIRPVTL